MKHGILKKYLALIVFVAQTQIVFAQISAKIDERFELTTVVLRLTGENAFTRAPESKYTADIDSCFAKFKNHELIEYVKRTVHSRNILNLCLPVDLAGDIKITPKGVALNDTWNLSCNGPDSSSGTWTKSELKEYVSLLDKFYKETNFHSFFTSHLDFYSKVEANANVIVSQIDTAWFLNYFGQSFDMANIWIVPLLGPHNFMDRRVGKSDKIYRNCALGTTQTDSLGYPTFDSRYLRVLIHEVCHNYNNPICEKYEDDFRQVCDTLFTFVGELLTSEHYGDPMSILYEGLNRACEYSYYIDHQIFSKEEIDRFIRSEEVIGFIWLSEMLQYMEAFRANRALFPTFEQFVPHLRLFLNQVVEKKDDYYLPKKKSMQPFVVATFPASNAIVDTTLQTVEILFSKPMQGYIWVGAVDSSYHALPLPVDDYDNIYWLNEYHYVIHLTEPLKPHTRYGFRVRSAPGSTYGWPTVPYDLIFETK